MITVLRFILSIIFGGISYGLLNYLNTRGYQVFKGLPLVRYNHLAFFTISILVAIIFYIVCSSWFTRIITSQMNKIEETLSRMSLKDLLISVGSVLIGLVIANLLGIGILRYGLIGTAIVMLLNITFGYLGYRIAQRKKEDINILELCATSEESFARPKILDTSVIIDGRILDILKTGFIEGKILIPNFVLGELRHIADSSDSLKRNRGRRGLDILNEIQKQLQIPVEIIEREYKEIPEVDSKLLKMAEEMNAIVVTNDFNLNKVADFQGVLVLNINELANAIKPIVLPGEEMIVTIIKDGKEEEQGIGYLNDGTMIVVEGGRKSIGKTVDVLVTSVLQTAAGRMIFTKTKDKDE